MRILKLIQYILIVVFISCFALANEPIGTIGIVVGQADVINRDMDIEIKDNIYFGDVIKTGAQTNLQILFDDETVFTIGENTEIVINEFIYDPNQSNELNTISAEVVQGSLKVVTGLIAKQNPENLSITLPTGVLATRGTEVQALVKPGQNDVVVLLGPGPNNAAGERPGAVEVSNEQGSVFMDQQFSFTSIIPNQPPSPPQPAPIALIQEINQSLSAGTIALANADSELIEENESSEDVASNEDPGQEEGSEAETITSLSANAINDEVKSVIAEEFDSEEGLLKASIPKVMTIVINSKKRSNSMTESESSMLNNVNNLMGAKMSLANLITDDDFMEEFNTYLESYELSNVPQLKTKIRQTEKAVSKATKAEATSEKASTKAEDAQVALQEERKEAKLEGRKVDTKIIKKEKKTKQKAKKAKQKAKQAAKKAAKKAAQAAKKAAKLAAKNIVVASGTLSTWQEIVSKSSGTYTYDANSIVLSIVKGDGEGTINAESVIDFANRTIKVTYDGDVRLGTHIIGTATKHRKTFSTSRTRSFANGDVGSVSDDDFSYDVNNINADYVDSNGYLQETYNFNIKKPGGTNNKYITDSYGGGDTITTLTDLTARDNDGKWLAKEEGGGNGAWYFANTTFQATNGSGASDIASTGTFAITIENLDSDSGSGDIKNQLQGSSTVTATAN